jgi:hypothetical protein
MGAGSDVLIVETDPVESWALEWRREGEVVLLFLDRSDDDPEGRYHPINRQGVFVVSGEDVKAPATIPLLSRSRSCLLDP